MEHPYHRYEGTTTWRVLERAIAELQQNQDISLTTRREYVIGYLCQELSRCVNTPDAADDS